jgi:hypothetical protein
VCNRTRRCTRPPQRTPAPVASLRHTSCRNPATPGTEEANSAGARDAPAARNHTGRQPQGHTGANRACRRNAPHRDTQTARDRTPSGQETHGRSDQTEDAKAEHERTTEAASEAPRRTPGHAPKGGHPARQNQRRQTPDAQAKRPPTHKRPPQTPQQESSPGTETDHATRTRNPRKPQLTDTPEEEASEADAARPNGHEKHRNSRKDSKTRSKQMVVGGKLLRGGKLQAQKRPLGAR